MQIFKFNLSIYYLTTTWLRTRPCATGLINECQVGTPIRQIFDYNKMNKENINNCTNSLLFKSCHPILKLNFNNFAECLGLQRDLFIVPENGGC